MHFYKTILVLLFWKNYVLSVENVKIDSQKTILWGPGLTPERVTMRARYFFLQLVDVNGKNLTESPGANIVYTQFEGTTINGQKCHAWMQIFDTKDGSFIVRYKVHVTCYNVKLTVKVNNENVPLLQSTFKGPVYEEECYCPELSIDRFLENYQCNMNFSQMQHDLSFFPIINFDRIRDKLIKRYHQPNSISFCHYVVKENKIYRKCYGKHVGFKIFMDSTLTFLARKVMLPDVEFFMNLGDWPLVSKDKALYPMFSWCGSENTRDIVLPTYDITESSMEAMGRVMLDILSVQGNSEASWNKKIEKVFWRGRDSSRERLNLIDIAREHPDLFNASITNFFFFKDEIDKYGPGTSHVSFFSFFKYKYQLNLDGTVAAYRFPYLLAGDSLVFKQDSNYYEFFYKNLVSGIHYVSIKRNLSDLVEKVLWAKEHDEEALNISKNVRQFVRDNLLPEHIICYHVVLLNEWSKRLQSQVTVLDDMEEVTQPKHSCKCPVLHINNNAKDEL